MCGTRSPRGARVQPAAGGLRRARQALALGLVLAAAAAGGAQQVLSAAELRDLRARAQRAAGAQAVLGPAGRVEHRFGGVAALAGEVPALDGAGALRSVGLYTGLPATGYWSYGQTLYWALDDGKMGPAAAAAGGGRVTAYQFSFGIHSDFAGDTVQPLVVVSYYNAPPDPVAGATDPVVEPPAPVSSIAWLFSPLTPPAAGDYAYSSILINLAALGLDFDLDETFYVEILPLEWNGTHGVFDPDVHAVFTNSGSVTYGANQDRMWSDIFVYSPGFTWGDGDGFYDHPAELDLGGAAPMLDQSGVRLVGLECPGVNTLALGIDEPADICVRPGEPVTVTLAQTCLPQAVRGYQAFLAFDPAGLTFGSGTYIVPLPYGLPILAPITAAGGALDLAAGIDNPSGQVPTSTTADLVTLEFVAGPGEGFAQVTFRAHEPPTRFSDEFGVEVVPTLVDSPLICVDGTPPEITCPPDLSLQCPGDVPAAATDLAGLIAQGGSAGDSGCYPVVTVTHVGDTDNGGAGCPGDPYIVWRTYRAADCAGNTADCTQTITVVDDRPPDITCPPDVAVNADAGGCQAGLDPGTATATDNCDPAPLVEYKRSDRASWNEGRLDPYPAGTTTITWRATDACGNVRECVQTIDVAAVNELVVSVQLSPTVASPLSRCITFELWDCSAPLRVVHEETLTFVNGVATATLEVPCGAYDCITARDRLHTLRRTDDALAVIGTQYLADFTGGDQLIGGNLNDDRWIDILDFGVFTSRWHVNYGTGDTPCGTSAPHADVTGNGLVDAGDFTFIQIHFLKGHEANCCGQPGRPDGGPVTAISRAELERRGLAELAAGDLNGDGWLDVADVAAFLGGARPRLPEEEDLPAAGPPQAGPELRPGARRVR